MEGLTFTSRTYNKEYYYNPLANRQSWKPYDINPDNFQYIFGNWERKISKTFKKPYYYNSEDKIGQWAIPSTVIVSSPDPGPIPTSSKPFPFDVFSEIASPDIGLLKAQIFYNILPGMYPEYGPTLTEELLSEKIRNGDEIEHIVRVNEYIMDNNLKSGDIIYYGTTYESRPEYGFGIVKRDDYDFEDQFITTELFYGLRDLTEGETYEENIGRMIREKCVLNNVPTTTNYEVAVTQILLWADTGFFKGAMFQ